MFNWLYKHIPPLAVLLFASQAHADILNSGFSVEYEVYKDETYIGVARRTLKKLPDNHWLYHSSTEAKGFISLFVSDVINEQSRLKQTHDQIIPLQYNYDQTGGKREKHYQLDFDWDSMQATNQDKQSLEMRPRSQDLLSFQLQIMKVLRNNPGQLDLHIVSRNKTYKHTLLKKDDEKIETQIGELSTRVYADKEYTVWSAPSIEYLPVKIRKTEDDGDIIELVIKSFRL